MNTPTPEEAGFSPERLKIADQTMRRFVEERKYPGLLSLLARRGKIAHFECFGMADIEADRPVREDTIWRIYSMTKPITSVAVLMLMEEGLLRLSDPVATYIPSFEKQKVLGEGYGKLVDAVRPTTIFDLLTHTGGLSYGFDGENVIDRMYSEQVWKTRENSPDMTLVEFVDRIAALPLLSQPGTRYSYSVSTDVLGCVVQVVSGAKFEDFLHTHLFEPLGMRDTAFYVPAGKASRFAANYKPDGEGGLTPTDPFEKSRFAKPPSCPSGGGGLVSTAGDYLKFGQMLLMGGTLDGVRIVGRKTVELMTADRMPYGVYPFGSPHGGFGLGVGMATGGSGMAQLNSIGAYGWGGAASTIWFNDPSEDMVAILMTQLMENPHPLGDFFRNTIYQALL